MKTQVILDDNMFYKDLKQNEVPQKGNHFK